MSNKWKWKGGRLEKGEVSLSIADAYSQIPTCPEIEQACKKILIPYDRAKDERAE